MANTDNLVSEKALGQFLHDLGELYNWKMYHQIDMGACPNCHRPNYSKRIGPGFPDWVLAHENGRLIFAELKSQKGVLKEEQAAWLKTLNVGGGREVYLWRPSDMDAIAQILIPAHDAPIGETLVLPAKDLPPWPALVDQAP